MRPICSCRRLTPAKLAKGRAQVAGSQASVETSGQAGERITDVVIATQRQVKSPHFAPRPAQGETRTLGTGSED